MSPMPLCRHRPGANFDLSPGATANCPHLAALAMQVVAEWSLVELGFAKILTGLLRSDFGVTSAMLAGLRGGDALRAAVGAAVKFKAPNDADLFDAVMRDIKSIRERRNEYAHGIWGWSPDCPDALLLVDARYLIQHHGNIEHDIRELGQWLGEVISGTVAGGPIASTPIGGDHSPARPKPKPADIDPCRILVYPESDFTSDLARVRHARAVVGSLDHVLSGRRGADAARTKLKRTLGM